MLNLTYRKCIPSDVKKAVPLIYASGPDAFSYVFRNKNCSAQDFLSHAFISKGGEFSYDNHFVILKDQKIIGIGAAFSEKRAKAFMFWDIIKILNFYKLSAFSVMIRGLKIEQVLLLPRKNEVCLAHISISPDERSKGYGQLLIEFLMQQKEAIPDSNFVLDVSEENPRAKSLYERLGFVEKRHISSNLKSNYGYVPNHFRMEKKGIAFKHSSK